MKKERGVLLLSLLAAMAIPDLSAAQEDSSGDAEPGATPSETPAATPQPTPEEPGSGKVSPWGLGVGLGWNFPADLGTPNTASLRIRRGSFALEPSIAVTGSGEWSKDSVDQSNESVDRVGGWMTTVGIGARKQMATRGRVGLVGIVLPTATFADAQSNPEGTDNALRSTSLASTLAWGLGLEFSPLPEWTISLDATSPLATVTWSRTYAMETNASHQETAFEAGLTLVPQVRAMAHLQF